MWEHWWEDTAQWLQGCGLFMENWKISGKMLRAWLEDSTKKGIHILIDTVTLAAAAAVCTTHSCICACGYPTRTRCVCVFVCMCMKTTLQSYSLTLGIRQLRCVMCDFWAHIVQCARVRVWVAYLYCPRHTNVPFSKHRLSDHIISGCSIYIVTFIGEL